MTLVSYAPCTVELDASEEILEVCSSLHTNQVMREAPMSEKLKPQSFQDVYGDVEGSYDLGAPLGSFGGL